MKSTIYQPISIPGQDRDDDPGADGLDRNKNPVDMLLTLLEMLGLSMTDAIEAVVSRVGPPGVRGMLSNWTKLKHFNFSAPPTKVIEQVFIRAAFRCQQCGTQLRLSVDHKDRDGSNHADENLGLKCMPCNQGYTHIKTALTLAALHLFNTLGEFPSEKQILERAGLTDIGSYRLYVMTYLRLRFEANRREKKIGALLTEFRHLQRSPPIPAGMRKVEILLEMAMEMRAVHGESAFAKVLGRSPSPAELVESMADILLERKTVG